MALLTAGAMRSSAVRERTKKLIGKKISSAQKNLAKKRLDPLRKKIYARNENRWKKLLEEGLSEIVIKIVLDMICFISFNILYNLTKYSTDDSKTFKLGFAIGLFLNETVLMVPELIIAYPLTAPFKKLATRFPYVDDTLHRISDWGLGSLRNELDRRNGIYFQFKIDFSPVRKNLYFTV